MTNDVGKQATWLTPSLVGDTQWNHWLKKTRTAHMFNRLCYSTLDEIIVSAYFTSIVKKFAIRIHIKRMDALSVKSNT